MNKYGRIRAPSVKAGQRGTELDGRPPKSSKDNAYLLVYDSVLQANDPLNSLLVRGREEAGLGETFSCGHVGVGTAGGIYEDVTTIGDKFHTVGESRSLEEMEEQMRKAKNDFEKDGGISSSADETKIDKDQRKDKGDLIEAKIAQLRDRKVEIAKRHAALLKKILCYEKDIEMQEKKRRQEASVAAKESSPSQLISTANEDFSKELSSPSPSRDGETGGLQPEGPELQLDLPAGGLTPPDRDVLLSASQRREMQVASLRELSYANKRRTQESKSSVKNFTAYKEHVVAAAKQWRCKAAGGAVNPLASHFRDRLMLRYELLVKIFDSIEYLGALKRRCSEAEQREEQREEEELTRLHETSSAELESCRWLLEAESQLMQLQALSSKLSSQLAHVRMAVLNMYNIARRFCKSLPPLQAESEHGSVEEENIGKMLELLKHFLQDTQTAVAMADADMRPSSTKPTLGSRH